MQGYFCDCLAAVLAGWQVLALSPGFSPVLALEVASQGGCQIQIPVDSE